MHTLTGLICITKMWSLKLLREICCRSFNSTRYFRASVFGSNTMNEVPVTTRTTGTPWERGRGGGGGGGGGGEGRGREGRRGEAGDVGGWIEKNKGGREAGKE